MRISRRAFLAAAILGSGPLAACTSGPPNPPGTTPPSSGPATPAPPRPATSQPGSPGQITGWQSVLLQAGTDGQLHYGERAGMRLPDFGQAGYQGGRQPVPAVPAVHTAAPVAGDNTRHLQQAIDHVGSFPPGPDGFRGALQLRAGTYPLTGTLTVRTSGVVVRGTGDGADPTTSTILQAVGNTPAGRDVIVLGAGGAWDGQRPGTRTPITSGQVPLGSLTLNVAAPGRLRPGDPVVIVHPCTSQWLAAIHGGGTAGGPSWQPGSVPITYLRRVTDISGDTLTLDAPLYITLDHARAPSYLYAWDTAGLVTGVGAENLRIDIATAGPTDEHHAANGIRLTNVANAWVRGCTILHFTKAGILTDSATHTTITTCNALDPHSRVTGGRRYNFDAEARSQHILFTNCHARNGRHSFIVNGAGTASGIVFHNTTATGSLASSEGHRHWSQGILFDNHTDTQPVTDRTILLGDRGDYGTSHGWSAVNSVAWNTTAGKAAQITVQQPPTAQNYAIGCHGTVDGRGPFPAPTGHIEGTNRPGLTPASLYQSQRP